MASTNSSIQYKADAYGVNAGQLAVSRDPWPEFFGDPHFPNSSAYDVEMRDTQILPEGYKGNNQMLRDRTEHLVYTDENWYTQEVMPIEVVAHSNKISWNKTEYGTQIPGLVPELGTVRILSSRRIAGSASFDRRGLGFYLEHGFMHTEAGRRDYQNQLIQIANSVIEGAKLDVINTLLTAQDINREWETEHGVYKGRHLRDVLQKQVWMWACLQKYERAEMLLDNKVNAWMEPYRGRADTWIMPPAVQTYLAIAPTEMIEYYRAGPSGPARLFDGPKAITTIGKSRVFFTRSFEVDTTGPRDLLAFPWEIGEYNTMYDRNRNKSYEGYRSIWRHIKIFNEDEDKMAEISLKWALDNSQRFDKNGDLVETPAEFDSYLGDYGRAAGADVFRYFDKDANAYRDTAYFGQMENDYFTAADKLNLARTVLQAFRASSRDYGSFERAWAAGIDLIDRIDALGADSLPGADTIAEAIAAADSLPAGVGTWAGLQAMAAAADNIKRVTPEFIGAAPDEAAAEKNKALYADLKAAKEFTSAVRALVTKMKAIFPGSLGLEAKGGKSAEATFFENFVSRHRVPLYKVAGGAQAAGPQAALKQLYLQFEAALAQPDVAAAKAALKNNLSTNRAQEERRVLAYAALSLIDKKASPEARAAAIARIGEITNNFDVTKVFRTGDDRDAFYDAIIATGVYSAPDRVRTKIDGYIDSNLANALASSAVALAADKYERTPFTASPQVVRDLAKQAANGGAPAFMPGSTANPDIAMSISELKALAAKMGVDDDSEFDLDPISERIPEAFTGIASELGSASAMVAAVLRADSAAGAGAGAQNRIGAAYAYGAGGGDYEDEMMVGAEFPPGRPVSARDRVPPRQGAGARRPADERAAELATEAARSSWRSINDESGGDRLLAAIAHVYDYTPINKRALERLIEQNIVFPLGFVIARPHMTYPMLCGIKVLAGREMGVFCQQPGRFEVGDDVDVQAHIGTYTYKSKAVVHEPKYVFIARNIFSNGYLGGCGVRAINPDRYVAGSGANGQESIIVLAVPYGSHHVTDIMDLTGSIRMFEEQYQLQARKQLDYIGADFYNRLYGWRQAQQNGEEAWSASDFINEKANVNTICHPGMQLYFNPVEGEFNIIQRGRGHWAGTEYPGCAAVRRGEQIAFDRQRAAWQGFIEA